MSHQDPQDELLEEEEEAFIDIDDPNVEVLDDSEPQPIPSSSDDDDERPNASGVEEGDGDDGGEPQQTAEVEDLNAVEDHVPERDDAFATFTSTQRLPVHAVASQVKTASRFAASGESEEIFILQQKDESITLVESLKGHTDTVSLLQFSPDGKWLASGSLDCSVRLWSTETWSCVHQLSDLYGEIMCLLWHPSSLLLVGGADDAQLAMWNVQKGTLAMYFVGHRGPVTCALWTPDVKRLVSGSSDGSVSVFSPKTGAAEISVTKDLSNDNAGVTTLCFVNSDQCIVGCEDGTIHVVSVRSEKVVSHFEELHEQAIESMCVNDLSTLLLTASCDCKLIIWNVNDFSPRTVFDVKESVIPALWVNSSVVAAGCSDGVVRVWDGRSEKQEPLREYMGHCRMVFQLALVEDMIVSCSDDGCVKSFKLTLPPDA